MKHTTAYSKSGKKLHKNSKGKWVNSKGSRMKAAKYSKSKGKRKGRKSKK